MGVVTEIVSAPIFKNKWFWIIAIGLIVIYVIYRWGKNNAANIVDYKHGTDAIPAGWDPNILADEVYQNTDTFFISNITQNKTFYNVANLPTDDMVVAVYNTYNTKYQSKDSQTMTARIASITAVEPDFMGGVGGNRDSAVNRLRNTGCA